MIKEEVIVHILHIRRIGTRFHFQISLPHDTLKIIGIEYGVLKVEGVSLSSTNSWGIGGNEIDMYMRVQSNKLIGKLSLQNPGFENIFFQGDLIENRNWVLNEGINSTAFSPFEWTHCRKKEEISLCVDSNTRFIEGYFQDSFGTGEYETLGYDLHLYLWIEKCNP